MRSPSSPPPAASARPRRHLPWRNILDALALGTWSAMLFRYWFGGKLLLLLHPDYAWLSNTAAIVLAIMSAFTLFRAFKGLTKRASGADEGHVTLMPPSISSALLLAIAVFGLIYTPRAFASQTAEQRGIADTLTLTRAQPQRFARGASAEERTIIDWIRLVNVYPEPDEYAGEPVDVKGFVIHPDNWPANYLMVSRFVLTCCAADAYPVGLPVKLPEGTERGQYPVDSWLSIQGEMISDTVDERRQVVIVPEALTAVEEPKNPYEY